MVYDVRNTIGQVIHPDSSHDLEASLRVHSMLVTRSRAEKWRFKGSYVTTGPFEVLMGHPGCGSSSGCTAWCTLRLCAADGLESITRRLNQKIIKAMCSYPDLAALSETVKDQRFIYCGDAIDCLARFERARTCKPLNRCHKRARRVENVRLECSDRGISLGADVTLTGSSWGLFWLARENSPTWNERNRLATWIRQAARTLDRLAIPGAGRSGGVGAWATQP